MTEHVIWDYGTREEIWNKYCGFLDLKVSEFMAIQDKLLMEHVRLLAGCELGKTLMKNKVPKNREEFRNTVPLTDYSFYEPFLSQKKEDMLPVKPFDWVCTSGVGGARKWVPIPPGLSDLLSDVGACLMLLACSTGKGKYSLKPNDKVFAAMPPPPYFSGFMMKRTTQVCGLTLIPPMDEEYEIADLPTRAARGFRMALESGIDIMLGLPGVLVKVGEQLGQRKAKPQGMPPPKMLLRMMKGMLKSRLAGRPLVPGDLWHLKTCIVSGMDLEAFKDKVVKYWGVNPYEFYAQTEFLGAPAYQTWTRQAMTPYPYVGFFEFIPEKESMESLKDPGFQPPTCLLNELQIGKSYEMVFTNFYGGSLARYRPKDMITVVALEDEGAGIKLPQWVFKGRADKLIDLGGFTRIDERTIWQALEDANIKYEDWMASKESGRESPVLHVYISTDTKEDIEKMRERLRVSLRKFDSSYADLEDMLGWQPIQLTLLPLGVFARWQEERVAAGADPAFVKDQRMQPPIEAVRRIKELAREMK